MKISTPTQRLIQLDKNTYAIEVSTETKDAFGVATTFWRRALTISEVKSKDNVYRSLYGDDKVEVETVLWILKNL